MEIKKDPRKYQFDILFLIIFLFALSLCVYIPKYMIDGTFILSERPREGGEVYTFTVEWSSLLQIICLGPVFGIVYFILMKLLLEKVDKNMGKNKYYAWMIEIAVVLLIALNCMAHILHLAFDAVNVIDHSGGVGSGNYNSYDTRETSLFIWYMDEWLGHTLVHITYFGYLVLAVITELIAKKHEKIVLDELVWVIISAIGISILDAWVAIKSECAFLLLVFHSIFTILALIIIYAKKINLRKYPILLAMILSIIPVVYFNLEFILTNGIKAYYPFYSSNLF